MCAADLAVRWSRCRPCNRVPKYIKYSPVAEVIQSLPHVGAKVHSFDMSNYAQAEIERESQFPY